jgi:hypothetical protein
MSSPLEAQTLEGVIASLCRTYISSREDMRKGPYETEASRFSRLNSIAEGWGTKTFRVTYSEGGQQYDPETEIFEMTIRSLGREHSCKISYGIYRPVQGVGIGNGPIRIQGTTRSDSGFVQTRWSIRAKIPRQTAAAEDILRPPLEFTIRVQAWYSPRSFSGFPDDSVPFVISPVSMQISRGGRVIHSWSYEPL